jgi:hypothetical protein
VLALLLPPFLLHCGPRRCIAWLRIFITMFIVVDPIRQADDNGRVVGFVGQR